MGNPGGGGMDTAGCIDSPRVELGREKPGVGLTDGTEDTGGTEVVIGLELLEGGVTGRDVDSPRVELGDIPGHSAEEGTLSISGLLAGASR